MSYHFAARGFWLPCDQAHFFHHEDHKALRATIDLATLDRSGEADKLDDQVYHRLAVVLGTEKWGFTHAIPVHHADRPFGQDPDAGVFIHERFMGEPFTVQREDAKEKPFKVELPADVTTEGLALLVNSSGFYLVLARYHIKEDSAAEQHAHTVAVKIQEYLRWYIYKLVGGSFSSRYSGWPDDRYLVTDQYELDHTLQKYADDHLGILTFDQINTIFEGLYSSALDFEVFFYDSESLKAEQVQKVKRGYSLGRFVDIVSTEVIRAEYGRHAPGDNQYDEELHTPDAHQADKAFDLLWRLNGLHPHAKPDATTEAQKPTGTHKMKAEAHRLCHGYLGGGGCAVLLRKFLQATAANTLQDYKRRMERCRRALVTEILEVTQRQDPLVQVEVPDKGTNRIVGANEAQLRGYVLLFSAKLPLINNVRLYLNEITSVTSWFRSSREHGATISAGTHASGQQKPPHNEAEREVAAALKLWQTLYSALDSDVRGLERAIEQERMDTMVREETKVRVEQETLAEIERLQDRTSKSLSPRQTLTISALANIFALFSVIIALLEVVNVSGIGTQKPGTRPTTSMSVWQALLSNLSWGTGLVFLGAVAGLALLYWVMHEAVTVVLAEISRLLKRAHIHLGERFYYEMDVHLEVPLDGMRAAELLEGRFPLLKDEVSNSATKSSAKDAAASKDVGVANDAAKDPGVVDDEAANGGATDGAEPRAGTAEDWLARGNAFWSQLGQLTRRARRALRPTTWREWWSHWSRLRARTFKDIERNSYRVERMTANEAAHKIYVEGTLRLPGKQGFWRRNPRIPLILVYELLYHRPTEAHRFILQDLRVVSTNPLVLKGPQLAFLKGEVVRLFVNPFVSQPPEGQASAVTSARQAQGLRWEATADAPADALMSLTGQVERPKAIKLPLWERLWLSLLRATREVLMLGGLGAAIYVIRALIVAGEQVGPAGLQILFDGKTLIHTLALDEVGRLLADRWWVALLPAGLVALLTLLFTGVGAVKQRQAKEQAERQDGEGGPGEPQAVEQAQPQAPTTTDKQVPARMGVGTRVAGVLGLLAIGVLQGLRVVTLLLLATAGIVASVPVVGDLWRLLVDHVWR